MKLRSPKNSQLLPFDPVRNALLDERPVRRNAGAGADHDDRRVAVGAAGGSAGSA